MNADSSEQLNMFSAFNQAGPLMRSDAARAPRRLPPAARTTDPVTSHTAAAQHTKSGKRRTNLDRVVELVQQEPGATCRELETYVQARHQKHLVTLDYHEVMRRLSDACKAGLVAQGRPRRCAIAARDCTTWWPAGKVNPRFRPEANAETEGAMTS